MRTTSISQRYTNRTTSEKPAFLYVEGMVCGFPNSSFRHPGYVDPEPASLEADMIWRPARLVPSEHLPQLVGCRRDA